MKTLTRWAIERPRMVLAAWLLLLAAAVPFALQLEGGLKAGGFSDPRGASAQAQHTLEHAFHEAPNSLLVVLHDDGGHVAASVPAARSAVPVKGVTAITDYRTHPEWLSRDGRTTFFQVGFGSDNTTVQNLVPTVRADVTAKVPGAVRVDVTGAPALDYALNVHSAQDAARAEMIAFPVLFVVLLLVFRSVAAMAVPLVMAGFTLAITEAIGYGMARVTDVNSLFTNIVSMVGLAVAVDYSLFIIKRFRDELAEGHEVPEAIERSMRTVGHSVVFSGLAVAVAMSALFVPRAMSFTSIALGGVTVTAIAVAMATTLLPAALRLLGHRINWGTLRRRGRAAGPATPAQASGFVARPALLLIVLVAGFAALAFPATQLTWQVPVASATILPADDQARVGLERIQHDIGLREMFPVQVVLTAPNGRQDALLAAVHTVAADARKTPGAAGVTAVTTLGLPEAQLPQVLAAQGAGLPAGARAALGGLWTRDGGTLVTRVLVTPAAEPDTATAHQLVKALRGDLPAVGGRQVTARLAGATASGSDFDELVLRSVPLVVAVVAALSLLILTLAFRSVLLPLLALAFNGMVVAASLGALALISADGRHTINSVTPLMLFAVMFGLSMDYMVIMISRMRELHTEGAAHREAVLGGLARTAGLVNGAAVIMVAVFVSFTSAQISIVREIGISLAIAVVLDAVVIRRLVMPATLLLIGERVWGRSRARGAGAAPGQPGHGTPTTREVSDQPQGLAAR